MDEIEGARTLRTFSPDTCNSELVTPILLTSSFWVASKFFSLKQTYQSVCRSLKLLWRSSDASQGLPVITVSKDVIKHQKRPYQLILDMCQAFPLLQTCSLPSTYHLIFSERKRINHGHLSQEFFGLNLALVLESE